MNKDYEKAIELVIRFSPEEEEDFFEEYKAIEYLHGKQLKSFTNMIHSGEKDKDFDECLAIFFSQNNYSHESEAENLKQLLNNVEKDSDEFKRTHDTLYNIFIKSVYDVNNSKGIFGSKLNKEKVDSFLDGMRYLLHLRINCLSVIAATAILKNWFKYAPMDSTRIMFLKQFHNIEVSSIPNTLTSLESTKLFLKYSVYIKQH